MTALHAIELELDRATARHAAAVDAGHGTARRRAKLEGIIAGLALAAHIIRSTKETR